MECLSSSMSMTDTENNEPPEIGKKTLNKESSQESPSKRNFDDTQRRMFKL